MDEMHCVGDIVNAVLDERKRQEDLYPNDNVRVCARHGDYVKAVSVLLQEWHEAAEELTIGHPTTAGAIPHFMPRVLGKDRQQRAIAELVQVAACAVGMVEGLLEKGASECHAEQTSLLQTSPESPLCSTDDQGESVLLEQS